MTANNSRRRTLRIAARSWDVSDAASAVAVEGDAVQLHAMIYEAEAELFGDPLLQQLQLLVDELDDRAGLDIDQMIVMRI